MLSINQLTHSLRGKPKRRKARENTSRAKMTGSSSMVSMSAYFVLAVSLPAHHIGGIHRTTWVQPFLCKLTDGSLIQETSIQMKDLRSLEVI